MSRAGDRDRGRIRVRLLALIMEILLDGRASSKLGWIILVITTTNIMRQRRGQDMTRGTDSRILCLDISMVWTLNMGLMTEPIIASDDIGFKVPRYQV